MCGWDKSNSCSSSSGCGVCVISVWISRWRWLAPSPSWRACQPSSWWCTSAPRMLSARQSRRPASTSGGDKEQSFPFCSVVLTQNNSNTSRRTNCCCNADILSPCDAGTLVSKHFRSETCRRDEQLWCVLIQRTNYCKIYTLIFVLHHCPRGTSGCSSCNMSLWLRRLTVNISSHLGLLINAKGCWRLSQLPLGERLGTTWTRADTHSQSHLWVI